MGKQSTWRRPADTYGPMFSMALTVLWIMVGASSHQIIYFGVVGLSGWVLTMGAAVLAYAALSLIGCQNWSFGVLRVAAGMTASVGVALVSLAINVFGSDHVLKLVGDAFSGVGLALSSLAVLRVLQASYDADQREFVCLTALVVAALLYFLVITLGMVPLILACSIAPALAMCLLGDDEGLRFARVEGSIQSAAATPAWDWLRVLSSLALPLGLSFMQGILLASERGIERPGEWSSVIGAATLGVVAAVLVFDGFLQKLTRRWLRHAGVPGLMLLICVGYLALGPNTGIVPAVLCYSYGLLYLPFLCIRLAPFSMWVSRPRSLCVCCLCLSSVLLLGSVAGLFLEPMGLTILGAIWAGCCLALLVFDTVAYVRGFDERGENGCAGQGDCPVAVVGASACGGDYIAGLEAKCADFGEKYGLSPREVEILALIARGRSAASIAVQKNITYNTVRSHVAHLYAKTGAHNREELMMLLEQPVGSILKP